MKDYSVLGTHLTIGATNAKEKVTERITYTFIFYLLGTLVGAKEGLVVVGTLVEARGWFACRNDF